MPDSPLFPGDSSVQETQDTCQPTLPLPRCQPHQSPVAPRTQPQPPQPAGRMGRGTHIHGSPMCRISQRIRVSWMLLRAKGHSCLSSRLLFSRMNWRRGPVPHITWTTDPAGCPSGGAQAPPAPPVSLSELALSQPWQEEFSLP